LSPRVYFFSKVGWVPCESTRPKRWWWF
jgi:hypothetical protein